MANGGNFHFAPGSGDIALYSGIGYILLGFVLAAAQSAPTWADLDQSFIFDRLPAAEAAAMRAQTHFVMTGVCDELFGDQLVGQYIVQDFFDAGDGWMDEPLEPAWLHGGLSHASCSNGYTMGNMVTAAAGPATFWSDLMKGKLVSPASLELMFDPPGGARPLYFESEGPNPPTPVNLTYGLGAMWPDRGPAEAMFPNNTVGHPGADWGSGSLAMFDRGSNFSIAINTVTAQWTGTNTSLSYADNQPFGNELLGALFDAAREFKAASN